MVMYFSSDIKNNNGPVTSLIAQILSVLFRVAAAIFSRITSLTIYSFKQVIREWQITSSPFLTVEVQSTINVGDGAK